MKILFSLILFMLSGRPIWAGTALEQLKSDINRAKWFQNTAFNDPTGMASLQLTLSLGAKYFQLPFLASEKSKILRPEETPSLQTIIDESFEKILSTSTGIQICI